MFAKSQKNNYYVDGGSIKSVLLPSRHDNAMLRANQNNLKILIEGAKEFNPIV